MAIGAEFEPEKKLNLFLDLKAQYPKVHAPERLALNVAEGVRFQELVEKYIRKALSKGVPPLFVDLRLDLEVFYQNILITTDQLPHGPCSSSCYFTKK